MMFYDSRNGYRFAGSTVARDIEVSLWILKWSGIVAAALGCIAMLKGCQNF